MMMMMMMMIYTISSTHYVSIILGSWADNGSACRKNPAFLLTVVLNLEGEV